MMEYIRECHWRIEMSQIHRVVLGTVLFLFVPLAMAQPQEEEDNARPNA